jgi:type II secretory pathway pseudopilin PulG
MAKIIDRVREWYRAKDGFTLIEAMAGMIMLSVGLLTLLPLATISIDANELARDSGDATVALQNQIEYLRTDTSITPGYRYDPETGMNTEWWVETDANGLQRVYVEVTWQTELGVHRRQRAITFLYRNSG